MRLVLVDVSIPSEVPQMVPFAQSITKLLVPLGVVSVSTAVGLGVGLRESMQIELKDVETELAHSSTLIQSKLDKKSEVAYSIELLLRNAEAASQVEFQNASRLMLDRHSAIESIAVYAPQHATEMSKQSAEGFIAPAFAVYASERGHSDDLAVSTALLQQYLGYTEQPVHSLDVSDLDNSAVLNVTYSFEQPDASNGGAWVVNVVVDPEIILDRVTVEDFDVAMYTDEGRAAFSEADKASTAVVSVFEGATQVDVGGSTYTVAVSHPISAYTLPLIPVLVGGGFGLALGLTGYGLFASSRDRRRLLVEHTESVEAEVRDKTAELKASTMLLSQALQDSERSAARAKASEGALRAQKLAVDSARTGTWDWDVPSGVVKTNRWWHEILGYEDHDELINVDYFKDLIHNDDLLSVFDGVNACHEGVSEYYDARFRMRHADGSYRWIRSLGRVLERDRDGAAVRMLGQHIDIHEEVQAKQRLRDSERDARRLSEISERTTAGIVLTDKDGRITWVNDAFTKITEYSFEEVIGRKPGHVLQNERTDPETVQQIRNALIAQEPIQCEILNVSKSGTEYWLRLDIQPFFEDGVCTGFMAFETDVTERKEREEQLARVNASLDAAQRIGELGSWEFDLETRQVRWSKFLYELYGRDPELGSPSFDEAMAYYAPHSAQALTNAVTHAIETGESFSLMLETACEDSRYRYIEGIGQARTDEHGYVVALFGTARNVTGQVEREDQLHALQHNLELFVSNNPAAVAMFDVQMKYLVASRAWIEQYDLRDSALIGESFFDMKGSMPEHWRDSHLRALAGESLAGDRELLHRPDGSELWLRWKLEPWRDESGEIGGVVMFTEDINDQVERERELETAVNAAQAASRSKSEFLANMSHEIRTPMTAILGFADLIQEVDDKDERDAHIETIKRNGQHLLGIINDILDLSRIESGKLSLEAIPYNPATLTQDAAGLLRVRADAKDITLSVEMGEGLPESVEGDPTRIRQVVMNLLGNAIKFTDAGVVSLRAEYDDVNQLMRYEIEDTGPGIAPERQAAIFQTFEQEDSSMARKHGGSGLGLAICTRLADAMGGVIKLEHSSVGEGSTFSFAFPAKPIDCDAIGAGDGADRAVRRVGDLVTEHSLENASILLVEDGKDNQRLISFHLKKLGAKVRIAENGKLGIEAFEQMSAEGSPPNAILMDMQMPEMDGYTAASELRSRGVATPIIALTAHAMAGDREKCLGAGCSEYMTKPIDRDRLEAALIALIFDAQRDESAAA